MGIKMIEAAKKILKTKQAKTALTAIGIVVLLAASFFFQSTPNEGDNKDGGNYLTGTELETTVYGEETTTMSLEEGESGSENNQSQANTEMVEATTQASTNKDEAATQASTERVTNATSSIQSTTPAPVDPEDTTIDKNKKVTCTFSIRCDTVLNNMDMLKEEKREIIPSDGVVLSPITVTVSQGESVFDALKQVTKNRGIHLEFQMTPAYNSAYIEGINNLYQFDCGNLSGWVFMVNGQTTNYGCSRYQIQEGDVVEWLYTCNMGKDLISSYPSLQEDVK